VSAARPTAEDVIFPVDSGDTFPSVPGRHQNSLRFALTLSRRRRQHRDLSQYAGKQLARQGDSPPAATEKRAYERAARGEKRLAWAGLIGSVTAFAASAMNSIAGGGTFIAFPTLVSVIGMTEKAANVTCTVGLWPGYAAAMGAARKDLAVEPRELLKGLMLVSAIGGVIGAALLLLTPPSLFKQVVPILLGAGTILFASGPRVNAALGRSKSGAISRRIMYPAIAAVAIYNGYFGGGGGVLVMAAVGLCGINETWRANVFKTVVQATSNATAFAVLAFSAIAWDVASGMWVGAAIGGFVGMRIAGRMPRRLLRAIIIIAGALLTIVYAHAAFMKV
jgi:uncharacterized protein